MENSNSNKQEEQNKMKNIGNKLAEEDDNNIKDGNIGNQLIELVNKDAETK